MKKILSIICAFVLLIGIMVLPLTVAAAAKTTIWFYNAKGWSKVNAYAYDESKAQPLGGWPGAAMKQDSNSRWWSVEVESDTAFNIIFSCGADQTGGCSIGEGEHTNVDDRLGKTFYLSTKNDTLFASRAEAEATMANELQEVQDSKQKVTLWFYNAKGWKNVYFYGYNSDPNEPFGGWPGKAARRDGDSYWYSAEITCSVPFNIIFSDGTDTEESKINGYISKAGEFFSIAVSDNNKVYSSKAEAEADAGEPIPIETATPSVSQPSGSSEASSPTVSGGSSAASGSDDTASAISPIESTGNTVDWQNIVIIVAFCAAAISAAALAVSIFLTKGRKAKDADGIIVNQDDFENGDNSDK